MLIDLRGRHTGDVILAMPALQTLRNNNVPVTVCIGKEYWGLLEPFDIELSCDFNIESHPTIPQPPKDHITQYWLNHLNVQPSRSKFIASEPEFNNYIILSPDSRDSSRRMSLQFWKSVGKEILNYDKRMVVIGPPDAVEYNSKICDALGIVDNLTGKDTISRLISLITHASAVITTDTAIAHLSDAIGTPTLTCYNSTDPNIFHTYWNPNIIKSVEDAQFQIGKILGS